MQNAHVFIASSLSEVLVYLRIHGLSGMLAIRRATAANQEGTVLQIERGQPVCIQGRHGQQPFDELALNYLLAWGPIHFTFSPLQRSNQLPPPRTKTTRQLPSDTHPLTGTPSQPIPFQHSPAFPAGHGPSARQTPPRLSMHGKHLLISPNAIPVSLVPPLETILQTLPRHDRTIFLLINGHRTVKDLAQLTRRSLESIQGSLQRLADQQIIGNA